MKSSFLVVSIASVVPLLFVKALSGTPAEKTKPATLSPGKPTDPGWPRQAIRHGNRLNYCMDK